MHCVDNSSTITKHPSVTCNKNGMAIRDLSHPMKRKLVISFDGNVAVLNGRLLNLFLMTRGLSVQHARILSSLTYSEVPATIKKISIVCEFLPGF